MASDATPVIDIHIRIQPLHVYKPHALALIQKGRRDYPEVQRYSFFLARGHSNMYMDISGIPPPHKDQLLNGGTL